MDQKTFDADADPEEVAAKLGLKVLQWHGGALYARDERVLYALSASSSAPRRRSPPTWARSSTPRARPPSMPA